MILTIVIIIIIIVIIIIIIVIIIIIIIIINISNNDAWWMTLVLCLSPWLNWSESGLSHHLSESFALWLRYASIDKRQSDCIPSSGRQSGSLNLVES